VLKQAFFATLAACVAAVAAVRAADYPQRPVSFIVPYAAGVRPT
jgi:tripartite-type tricarboxylate transporter receptor subunit TctC